MGADKRQSASNVVFAGAKNSMTMATPLSRHQIFAKKNQNRFKRSIPVLSNQRPTFYSRYNSNNFQGGNISANRMSAKIAVRALQDSSLEMTAEGVSENYASRQL